MAARYTSPRMQSKRLCRNQYLMRASRLGDIPLGMTTAVILFVAHTPLVELAKLRGVTTARAFEDRGSGDPTRCPSP